MAELAGGQLEDQLGDLLGELLDPTGGAAKRKGEDKLQTALARATREAAAEGLNGLRVSYLSWDLLNHKVTVQASFLARMPDGAWQPIWEHISTIDASKPRANQKEANDPEVTAAVELVAKALGVDPKDERVRMALGCEVVVKEAVHEVNRAFVEFMLPNVRRLDGPPLAVPDGPGAK